MARARVNETWQAHAKLNVLFSAIVYMVVFIAILYKFISTLFAGVQRDLHVSCVREESKEILNVCTNPSP